MTQKELTVLSLARAFDSISNELFESLRLGLEANGLHYVVQNLSEYLTQLLNDSLNTLKELAEVEEEGL